MAVQLPPNSTGTTLDTATVAGKDRQRVVVSDPSAANDQAVTAAGAAKVDGSAVTQPVSAASLPLPTGAATAAKQPALGTAGTPSADVISVQGVASGTVLPVVDKRSATGTQTNVASATASTTILASNAARLGATVYNDSTQVLYLLLSASAASSTVHSVQMAAGTYYELPFNYVGQVNGAWAAANGNARVTELT